MLIKSVQLALNIQKSIDEIEPMKKHILILNKSNIFTLALVCARCIKKKNAVMDFLLSVYPDLLKIENKYSYNSVLNDLLFYIYLGWNLLFCNFHTHVHGHHVSAGS